MSTDRIGELDQAIADIFRESRRTSVTAKPSLADFDHGTLADIFNDALPHSSNPEPSPSQLDHRTLAEIFGEPSRAPIDRPSLDIDQSSSPHLFGPHPFGEPGHRETAKHRMADRAPPTAPESAHRAESLLDKIRYIFTPKTDVRPHVPPAAAGRAPSLDEKKPLTESPLGFEPESLLFRPTDPPDGRRRTRDDNAATNWSESSETDQTGATAPPSLAEIITSVSADIQPPLPVTDERAPSLPATVGTNDEDLAADALRTPDGEDSWQQLESLLTERSRPPFPDALLRTSPRQTSRPRVVQQPDIPERGADTAPTEPEAQDLATAPAEASPKIPSAEKFRLPQAEDVAQDDMRTGPSDDAAETEGISAAFSADTESAPPQQISSPAELPSGVPAELKSPSLEAKVAVAEIPDQPNHPAQAADLLSNDAPADDPNADTALHDATLLSMDIPQSDLEPETDAPAISDRCDDIDATMEIAAAILSGDAESVDREQRDLQTSTQSFRRNPSTILSNAPVAPMPTIGSYRVQVAATQPYQSTPSPLIVRPTASSQNAEPKRASVSHGARLDQVEPVTRTTTVHPPIAAQSTPLSQASFEAEEPDTVSTALDDPALLEGRSHRQEIVEQPVDLGASTTGTVTNSTLASHDDVAPEFETKFLLSELDLDSAIRLRWVMRDIRANRVPISPISESDLTALSALGLVEMRGELPYLTASGERELD